MYMIEIYPLTKLYVIKQFAWKFDILESPDVAIKTVIKQWVLQLM